MNEVKWLLQYLDENSMLQEIQDTIETLVEWAGQHFSYESKNQRIAEWSPTEQDFYELVCHIYAGCLLHPQGMTYQAMIGYICGTIRCADPLDRAKIAAEVISVAYLCELIVITKVTSTTMMITTDHELPVQIPKFIQHRPEQSQPQPLDHNSILGNRFKRHTEDACIDHLDRMNRIPFTLETRIIDHLQETTSADLETQEQKDAWETFRQQSGEMYDLVRQDYHNEFYLQHSFDTRGRCYCSGYFINYQGASYKKAIVQLANKEVVQL